MPEEIRGPALGSPYKKARVWKMAPLLGFFYRLNVLYPNLTTSVY